MDHTIHHLYLIVEVSIPATHHDNDDNIYIKYVLYIIL